MIKLYTTGCPKCVVLANKLKEHGVEFEVVTDIALMLKNGFNFMPVLEVDGEMMEFGEAVKWVNSKGGK